MGLVRVFLRPAASISWVKALEMWLARASRLPEAGTSLGSVLGMVSEMAWARGFGLQVTVTLLAKAWVTVWAHASVHQ